MALLAKDVPVEEFFYTHERIGDDKNNMEIREVFYKRDPDGPCMHPHNVKVARCWIVQGDPTRTAQPRYYRQAINNDGQPCRDPGEMDGRTRVLLLRTHPATKWNQVKCELRKGTGENPNDVDGRRCPHCGGTGEEYIDDKEDN